MQYINCMAVGGHQGCILPVNVPYLLSSSHRGCPFDVQRVDRIFSNTKLGICDQLQ